MSRNGKALMTILSIAFGLPVLGFLLLVTFGDVLLCDDGVPAVRNMKWNESDYWYKIFTIENLEKEAVFNAALDQLQERGFTVCFEYYPVGGANNGLPCTSNCGTRTSLKRNIIVAEKVGLALREDGRASFWSLQVILGFRERDGSTQISMTRIRGSRMARAEWDGDLSVATAPSGFKQSEALFAELRSNLGRDIQNVLDR